MTPAPTDGKKYTALWDVEDIKGLECFRAYNMIHQFRRHSHEGYSIGVIEDGFGDNNYRGSVFHLAPGKIVVMNPDEVHTGQVVSDHTWSYRMFYINQETFRRILPQKSLLPFFRGLCFEDKIWFNRLQALHRLLQGRADTLEKQTRFIDVLATFAQAHGKVASAPDPGREPKAVSLIKDYIHAHFNQNISINELVRITRLSRAYLIRCFRHSVGIPPYAYLIQTRIRHAQKLLAKKTPVAQVAYEMGFSDQSHFTRHFKNIIGITPKQYAIGHHPPKNLRNVH
ncbi:MAG: AraC family transcriptional regulator [Desulfarculaceae bacterium]|jgi:AraC-like DNA-binding protein